MIHALEVQLVFLLDQSRSLDVSVHPGKQELDVTSMMVDRNKNKNSNVFFLIKKTPNNRCIKFKTLHS